MRSVSLGTSESLFVFLGLVIQETALHLVVGSYFERTGKLVQVPSARPGEHQHLPGSPRSPYRGDSAAVEQRVPLRSTPARLKAATLWKGTGTLSPVWLEMEFVYLQ